MIVPSEIDYDVFVLRSHGRAVSAQPLKSAKTGLKTREQAFPPCETAWSSICSSFVMETHRWLRTVTALLLLVILPAAHAQAQKPGMQRVRTDSRYLRLVLASGIERSPTFRRIVDLLEHSDLIVEVQCGRFTGSMQAGRTVLLSARPNVRYLLVEIACPMTTTPALCIVAHELRHALEIADAEWVVDGATLAGLYREIGFRNCDAYGSSCTEFETADALETGARVHRELLHPATRGTYE